MFECKGCGGNLRFDIESQMMLCPYCDSKSDPYDAEERSEAAMSHMDVTVFVCPQCGGEIYSADNSAAEFCSFCGASTILESRICSEKRPLKIVPFKKTNEECKVAYSKFLKRCLYAPKSLRNAEGTNEFRGIYMPYWCYSIVQKGMADVKGLKEHRSGDYIIKDHYRITGDLDARYDNIPYDAASNFADDISERVAPYNTEDMQDFTPAFLSGFYADIADVDDNVYRKQPKDLANRRTLAEISTYKGMSSYDVSSDNPNASFHTIVESVTPVMLPVWFMSYRTGDRISYATINGQTGKVAADVPIDMKRFAVGAVILAVIIDFILNLTLSLSARGMMIGATVLSIIVLLVFYAESYKITARETGEEDLGRLAKLGIKATGKASDSAENQNDKSDGNPDSKNDNNQDPATDDSPDAKAPYYKAARLLYVPIIAGIIIFFAKPHMDYWYYGVTVLALISTLYCVVRLVQRFNILASRKLPQLSRGGESNE